MRVLIVLLAALLLAPAAAGQGAEQAVAVLDTGIDADHPEFGDRVGRRSFVDFAGLPLDPGLVEDDPDGHGTAAASLVAGATLGVAPEARLLDLQVDAQYTQGQLDPAAEAAAIRALDWLLREHAQAGVRVALLSFAASPVSEEGAATLRAQTKQLFEDDVAVVVPDTTAPGPLHGSPWVLTVAMRERCAEAPQTGSPKPDLAAPGEDLEVAEPGMAALPGATTTSSGSHLAAGQVAGAVAALFAERPGLPVDAAYAIVRAAAEDIQEPGHDPCTGAGLLDVEAAVARARAWQDPFQPAGDEGNDSPTVPALLVVLALLGAAARRRRV